MFLQAVKLLRRQRDALRVQRSAEFLSWQVLFAQDVVILEELQQADAILLDDLLDLLHECLVCCLAAEVSESGNVS